MQQERNYVVFRLNKLPSTKGQLKKLSAGDESFITHSGFKIEGASLTTKQIRDLEKDPTFILKAPEMPLMLHKPVSRGTGGSANNLNAWGLQAVNALDTPYTGKGVTVAILDTGIDAKHPAFAGTQLIQQDFTGEGNGDDDGHGTHCAGTVFGKEINGTRIGIAPGISRALIGKVLGKKSSSSLVVTQAINWAGENGANIISMSLGIDFPGYVKELIQQGYPTEIATSLALHDYNWNIKLFEAVTNWVAKSYDTLIVAASGNESMRDQNPSYSITVSPPAAAEGIISVGALGRSNDKYSVALFSNAPPVVSAPGVDILSAKLGGGLTEMSGTSMATPHVAGIAALWAEKILGNSKNLTPTVLSAKLIASATLSKVLENERPNAGEGMVQAPLTEL